MTPDWGLDNFRMGTGGQTNQPQDERLRTPSASPPPLGRREDLEVEAHHQ